jgi:hypothetical protein
MNARLVRFELEHRWQMGADLLGRSGPTDAEPTLLRELRIYTAAARPSG